MSAMKQAGIPTIHDISYLKDPLLAIWKGDNSFKKLHETVLRTKRRIRSEERVSPSFDENEEFPDYFQMWAQTAKILRELMVLQLVEYRDTPSQPPSEQEKLDDAFSVNFQLTPLGSDLAARIDAKSADSDDILLDIMRKRHSAFARFISMLQASDVIYFPEIGVPKETLEAQLTVSGFVESVSQRTAEKLDAHECERTKLTIQEVSSHLTTYLGRDYVDSINLDRKRIAALVKKINQGTKVLLLKKLGLDIGVPSLEVLANWSRQLRIANFARGLLEKPGLTVYSTTTVDFDNHTSVRRRTKELVKDSIVANIPIYFQKLKTPGSPWAAIYPIRAELCFKSRINDEIFDEIIRDIFFQRISVPYKISLESDLWATPSPSTRPLLLYERQRRNIISVYDVRG
ncbi:hypothetical protein ES703_02474 [subsurface metagenome]